MSVVDMASQDVQQHHFLHPGWGALWDTYVQKAVGIATLKEFDETDVSSQPLVTHICVTLSDFLHLSLAKKGHSK